MLSQTQGQGCAAVGVGSLLAALSCPVACYLFPVQRWVHGKGPWVLGVKGTVSLCGPMALRLLLDTFHTEGPSLGISTDGEKEQIRKPEGWKRRRILLNSSAPTYGGLVWGNSAPRGTWWALSDHHGLLHSVETHLNISHWRKWRSELFAKKPQVGS